MKKLVLILLVAFMATTVSQAQNRGGQRNFDPEEMAKRQTETLKKELDLAKDQEKKVYEVSLKAGKEMAEARENAAGDREYMRKKMTKIRENQNNEMKKILSEKQWKKYQKYLEEMRERRGQGRR